jgi:hypothetical protein
MSITIRSAQTICNGITILGSAKDPITVITEGLILNLDARNRQSYPGSGNTWYDLSGNHHDATLYGGITYGGDYGGALSFDGSDEQYAQCPADIYFNGGSFTIQSWVYDIALQNWNRIIDFGNGAGANNILLSNSYETSGAPGLYIEGSQFQADTTIALNVWNQICATFTADGEGGGTAKIYINGQPHGSGSTGAPQNTQRSYCYIGKSNWGHGPDPNFNGGMGALQIYNRALSDAEMLSNYNTTKSRYGL